MQPEYEIATAVLELIEANAPPIVYVGLVVGVTAFVFNLLFYALSRLVKWSTPRD